MCLLYYRCSNLSDLFQNSITFDNNGKATGINQKAFAEGLGTIYSAIINGKPAEIAFNILTLVASIIPIIKYKILGFKPTETVTTISTSQATDQAKGIININDIIDNLNKILFTKAGFTNFFISIFIASKSHPSDDLFLGLDTTCTTKDGSFAVEQVISPIEYQLTQTLNNAFDNYIEPNIKKYHIDDIFNKITSDLKSVTTNFDININDIEAILSILGLDSTTKFLDKLTTFNNEAAMQAGWVELWTDAGLQDASNPNFAPNSLLANLQQLFVDKLNFPNFALNLNNLLTTVNEVTTDTSNIIIDNVNKKLTQEIDFNNQTLWKIHDSSITYQYDKKSNQSTINYTLTYNNKAYKVSVVVNTNVHDDITTNQKVWLKSLQGL